MLVVSDISKAHRSIKVCNLPAIISNDVLGFIFTESVNVERKPFDTTAIVEFGSVRDAENYILKDKTLMIEDKVLGIKSCSAKNDGPSDDDPLKCRQLYIENLPRSTTTEYLDVLFPFAKSIKRLDACSALAEYRTGKDAERELHKAKTLRIDRHELLVRLAKHCHRFGGGHDRHEKGHSSSATSDRSSILNANKSGSKKKSTTEKNDFLFSGKEILSDLYGLPAEFGRGSHSRQRTDGKKDTSFKKPLEKTTKKETASNRTSSKTSTSSSGRSSGRTKSGGSESKKESSSQSTKESDLKSDRQKPRTSRAVGSEKSPSNISNRDKPHASSSCATNEKSGLNSKSGGSKTRDRIKIPDVLPGTSSSSDYSNRQSNTDKRHHDQRDYSFDRSKYTWVDSGHSSSDNRRHERPIRRNEEFDDWTREKQDRDIEDKKNFDRNRSRMDRERSDERDRTDFKWKSLPDDETWREVKFTDRGRSRSSGRASCDRLDSKVDDFEKPPFRNTCYNLDKRPVYSSERGAYRDHSVYNSESTPERIRSGYRDPEFNRAVSDPVNFRNISDLVPDRTRDGRRPDWGERENKGLFPTRIYQNLKWSKEDSKTNQEGQSKIPIAERSRTYDKNPIMDRNRFNGEPNMKPDSRERHQDQFGQGLNLDRDEFYQGPHTDKDRSSRSSVINKRKFDHGKNVDDTVLDQEPFSSGSNMDRRRLDRGSTMDQGKLDRVSNMDQGRSDRASNMDQGRLDRVSNMDRERFGRNSSMDQERFDKGSNMDQERFAQGLNRDQGKFDWGPNIDRERFDKSSNVDHRRFDKGPNVDRERFDRGSNMDRERFDRSSNMSQGGFVKDPNTDQSRLDMDQERFHRGSNMNPGRFDRSLKMDHEMFDKESNIDHVRFNRISNMDHEIFERRSNTDQGRIGKGSNIDPGRFDRGSNMKQEIFDQGSNIDCQRSAMNRRMPNSNSNMDRDSHFNDNRFTGDSTVDQKISNNESNRSHNRFDRDYRIDQGRFDSGSKMNLNKFDEAPNMDQGRFEKCSTVDQNLFGTRSKRDQSPNTDPNRFSRAPNMDQGRFEKSSTVDQNVFGSRSKPDQSPNPDTNRFSRAPMDQGRFGRVPNTVQGEFERNPDMVKSSGFDRYPHMDQDRFARDPNMDQDRPGMGPNIDQNRFGKSPNMDQNRFDRYSNQDQNRFHVGQNRDQSRFNSSVNMGPNRDQNPNIDQSSSLGQSRFDHSANRDQSGLGKNLNNSRPNKTWKSDRFGRNDIEIDFKSDLNTNSQQYWGRPGMDNNTQNRREIPPGRHFDPLNHPEKRTFSNVEADDQWKTNMAARNFRHESREDESRQEFPNKRPRKDGSYNDTDGYFNTGPNPNPNRPGGQNNPMMNVYPLHTTTLHVSPPPLSSTRLPVMQSSLTSNTSQYHLAPSHRL